MLRRATLCYMETISHREMRNRSGEILRRVEAGESVQVTNNGRLSALIVPPAGRLIDALIASGEARAPLRSRMSILEVPLIESPETSEQIIEDARGRW